MKSKKIIEDKFKQVIGRCNDCGKRLTLKNLLTHKCKARYKLFYYKEFNWISVVLFSIMIYIIYHNKFKWSWLCVLLLWILIYLFEDIKNKVIRRINK